MLVYMMVVGITVLPALSNANSLMRNFPQRPICKLEQSCSYYAHPYTFSLCDCPEGRACPDEDEYAIHQDGIRYRFCEPRSIPVCRPQQIATTLNNILTSVHCICPEGLEIVKGPKEPNGTAHFFCGLNDESLVF